MTNAFHDDLKRPTIFWTNCWAFTGSIDPENLPKAKTNMMDTNKLDSNCKKKYNVKNAGGGEPTLCHHNPTTRYFPPGMSECHELE
jgi:hypothetical protein